MAQTNEIRTIITADNKQFKAGIKESTALVKDFGNKATQSFNILGKALTAAFAGGQVISYLKKGYESLDRMTASADRLGIASENFQLLEYAARRSDVEIGTLEGTLKKFRQSVANGGNFKLFSNLGLDQTKLQLMDTGDAFQLFISKIKTLSTSQQIDLAKQLGIRGFQDIISLVNSDMDAFNKKFKELGGAVNVDGFDEIDRAMDDLETRLVRYQRQFLVTFGTPAVKVLDALSKEMSVAFGSAPSSSKNNLNFKGEGITHFVGNVPTLPDMSGIFGKKGVDNQASSASSNAANAASSSILKLSNASETASAALGKFKELDLKEALGLGGISGQSYLAGILKPQEQITDQRFNDLANQLQQNVANGGSGFGMNNETILASMKAIAREYNGGSDGMKTNQGMKEAISLLEEKLKAAQPKDQKVVVELKYDQNGIIKAVVESASVMKVAGEVVEKLASQEAQSTGY